MIPERLTPEQLQEIEARLEKATPGPWQTRFIYRSLQSTRKHASEDHLMLGPDNDWNDADLTANAPTDIRALLAEIKALQQERDEAARDTKRLDFLQISDFITTTDATDIVNGFRYRGRYLGTLRNAIDAAMDAETRYA